jgi:hypothetical protein
MKNLLLYTTLLAVTGMANAAPVVYTDKTLYDNALVALGFSALHEGFEDTTVWGASRNTPATSVTSRGMLWSANYPENNIATSTVGGTAPEGLYAIYSSPHGKPDFVAGSGCDTAQDPNIPAECYQNAGLKVVSETGATLYAFGGQIFLNNTSAGAVTFLLDGVDIYGTTLDPDNLLRNGVSIDNVIIGDVVPWAFVGVIDEAGFLSAELREVTGKNSEASANVFMFSDDFTIGVTAVPVPAAFWLFGSGLLGIGIAGRNKRLKRVLPATADGDRRSAESTAP